MNRPSRLLLAISLTLALLGVACGGDDDGDGDTAANGDGTTTAGLVVTAVDIAGGSATITNRGDAAVELAGNWLCNRPIYVELPDQTLEPGQSVDVSIGLSEAGGEVALYSSSAFGSSDDILDYVSWGTGGGRQSVAVSAGVWSGDPVADAGETITLVGEPGTSAGWAG